MSIKLYYDQVDFRIKSWRKIVKVIEKVIIKEQKILGDLNFIITDDKKLRSLNIQFLEHDYDTDVITFNFNKGKVINGEVYISIDTVRINAVYFKESLNTEIIRVIIHGVLHLVGYDDKTEELIEEIRGMEDFWLGKLES